jgi:hypothetical protein
MQKKISGGIYLPVKELQNIVMETVLFLDESADLEKMGKQVSQLNPKIKSIMIKTRGKRSWDVVSEIHELIKKYSTGCEAAMARVDEKVKSYRLKIESYPEKKIIFFLGEIKEGQALPMKVIVGDLLLEIC